MQTVHHGIDSILCLVTDRKDAVAALYLDRHALLTEKFHDVLIVECTHGAVEESTVAMDIADDFRYVSRIRDIAAALARNADLPPKLCVLF